VQTVLIIALIYPEI
jgi:hypothetical protein